MTNRRFLPVLKSAVAFTSLIIVILALESCIEEDQDPLNDAEYTIVSTLAGSENPGMEDGVGALAKFNNPCGIALDSSGNLYVADHTNHSIRMITPDGTVTTYAGTGQAGFNDGFRLDATFNNPYGLALDAKGNLYIGDVANHAVRKITPDGIVTTLAGGRRGYSDRDGELAMFDHPHGVAVDAHDNIYVADAHNNVIRKITKDGVVSTVAGNGNDGFVDGPDSEAEFYVPIGIVVDVLGNVFVGDEGNSSIRKIAPDGNVTTIAGNGSFSFSDGTGTEAEFNAPGGIALDSEGNLYVADYLNNCIREVTPSGEVRTIAGNLEKGYADGKPAEAQFHYPFGIAVDATGRIYVGDYFNHRIRLIN